MKTIIKIFSVLCFLVAFSMPAAAIDKSKKKENPAVKKTVKVEKKTPAPEKAKGESGERSRVKKKKSYDSFIDKNNNGIDDRSEKSTTKKTKKKTTPDRSTAKKTKP